MLRDPTAPSSLCLFQAFFRHPLPTVWLKVSHLQQGRLQGLSVAKDVMPGQSLNQFCGVFFIPYPNHSSYILEELPLWRSSGTDGCTPRKGVPHFWSKTLHLPNAWILMCAWICVFPSHPGGALIPALCQGATKPCSASSPPSN